MVSDTQFLLYTCPRHRLSCTGRWQVFRSSCTLEKDHPFYAFQPFRACLLPVFVPLGVFPVSSSFFLLMFCFLHYILNLAQYTFAVETVSGICDNIIGYHCGCRTKYRFQDGNPVGESCLTQTLVDDATAMGWQLLEKHRALRLKMFEEHESKLEKILSIFNAVWLILKRHISILLKKHRVLLYIVI